MLGFVLLLVEIFLIPGFGVTGVLGIACLVAALAMALVEFELPWSVSWDLGYIHAAAEQVLVRLAVLVGVVFVAVIAFGRYFPTSPLGSWLVFRPKPGKDGTVALGAEAPGGSLQRSYDELLGRKGTLQTIVRPSGIAEFGGRRVHVLSDGEFLDKGTTVDVIEVDGHRVVVREAKEA